MKANHNGKFRRISATTANKNRNSDCGLRLNRSQKIEAELRQNAHQIATSYQDDNSFGIDISFADFEENLFNQLHRMRYRVPAIHTIMNLGENEGSASIINHEMFELRNTPLHSYAKTRARTF